MASRLRPRPADSHIQGPTWPGHPGARAQEDLGPCLPEGLREGEAPSCLCTSRSCLRSRREVGAHGLDSGQHGPGWAEHALRGPERASSTPGAQSRSPLGAVLPAAHRHLCPPPLPQAGRVALGCCLLALRSAEGLAEGTQGSMAESPSLGEEPQDPDARRPVPL